MTGPRPPAMENFPFRSFIRKFSDRRTAWRHSQPKPRRVSIGLFFLSGYCTLKGPQFFGRLGLVKTKNSNRPKQASFPRSQRGVTHEMTSSPTQIRQEMITSRNLPCHVFHKTFWNVLPGLLIDSMRPRKKYRDHPSPRWDWQLHILLMQSNVGSSMKVFKSCVKVIQRTLQSRKHWLRYSSFSAISRSFRLFGWFWSTLIKQENTSKIIDSSSSESWRLFQDLPFKSILMTCTEKVSIFLRSILETYLKITFFPVESPFEQNKSCQIWSISGRPPCWALICIKRGSQIYIS